MKSIDLLPYQEECERLLTKASEVHSRIPNSHFSPTHMDRSTSEGPKWTSGVLLEDPAIHGEDAIISLQLTGITSPESSEQGGWTMTGSKLTRAVIESAIMLDTFDESDNWFNNLSQARAALNDPNRGLPTNGALVRYATDHTTVVVTKQLYAVGLSQNTIYDTGSFLGSIDLLDAYLNEFNEALLRVNRAIGYTASLG